MRSGVRGVTAVGMVLAVASVLGACGDTSDSGDGESAPEVGSSALVAHVRDDVDEITAFDAPGSGVAVEGATLPNPRPIDEGPDAVPTVFLVKQEADDGWLEVYLPIRPNGATGWIERSAVELRRVPYRVEVNLSEFHLALYRDDELVLESDVGLGREDEPTPPGRYFITELLQPPDPDTVYGTYAYGLSGFSDVHFEFGGGPGQLGLHGTNDQSSIGGRASAGCIRLPNDVIEELVTMLPLGTPVEIVT